MKWGWDLRHLRHFALIGIGGIRAWVPRDHFLCASALLESHLLGIGCPCWSQSHPKLPLRAQGAPNGPTESQESQREAKVTPRRAPRKPEAPQRVRKGGPKLPQGQQHERQRHIKETNKSENYIHLNKLRTISRSTAIKRPTGIDIHIIININVPKAPLSRSAKFFWGSAPLKKDRFS